MPRKKPPSLHHPSTWPCQLFDELVEPPLLTSSIPWAHHTLCSPPCQSPLSPSSHTPLPQLHADFKILSGEEKKPFAVKAKVAMAAYHAACIDFEKSKSSKDAVVIFSFFLSFFCLFDLAKAQQSVVSSRRETKSITIVLNIHGIYIFSFKGGIQETQERCSYSWKISCCPGRCSRACCSHSCCWSKMLHSQWWSFSAVLHSDWNSQHLCSKLDKAHSLIRGL